MKKRILIVDDEPDIRFMLRALLTCKGYEIEEAEDGEAALKMIEAKGFDLVVLDVLMPKMDGYEVIRRIPPHVLKKTPVVLLTAQGESPDAMKGYSVGASYYITKPCKNQRILDAVGYLIGDLSVEQKEAVERRLQSAQADDWAAGRGDSSEELAHGEDR